MCGKDPEGESVPGSVVETDGSVSLTSHRVVIDFCSWQYTGTCFTVLVYCHLLNYLFISGPD